MSASAVVCPALVMQLSAMSAELSTGKRAAIGSSIARQGNKRFQVAEWVVTGFIPLQIKLALGFQDIQLLQSNAVDAVPANDNPALLRSVPCTGTHIPHPPPQSLSLAGCSA
jgi:hypothetical protein